MSYTPSTGGLTRTQSHGGKGGGGTGRVPAWEVSTFYVFTLPGSHDPGHEELVKLAHHPIM